MRASEHDGQIGEAIAAFIAQAGAGSPFAARPLVAWSADAGRILHASEGARALAESLAVDESGKVRDDLAPRPRLAALAGGLAPTNGQRLEKLRFVASRLAPQVTLACRRLELADGTSVLLTAFLDVLPVLPPPPRREPEPVATPAPAPQAIDAIAAPEEAPVPEESLVPDESPVAEEAREGAPAAASSEAIEEIGAAAASQDEVPVPSAGPEPHPEIDPEPEPQPEPPPVQPPPDPVAEMRRRFARRGVVRFVWRADAQGRLQEVSPTLASVVGAESAAVAGRTFAEILADQVHDPRDIVAELIARGETFSGRTVLWRFSGTPVGVEIDLAGLPMAPHGAGAREMRGFGLIRTDAIRAFPERAAPIVVEEAQVVEEPARDEGGSAEPEIEPHEAAPDGAAASADAEDAQREPEFTPEPALQARFGEAEGERYEATGAYEEPVSIESVTTTTQARLGTPEAVDALAPDAPANDVAPAAEPIASDAAQAQPGEALAAIAPDPEPEPAPEPETAPAAEHLPEPEPARREPLATTPMRLSPSEHSAFREIARALGARYAGDEDMPATPAAGAGAAQVAAFPARAPAPGADPLAAAALDRLPIGVIVHRGEETLHANRHLLDLTGHADLDAFRQAGGVASLVRGRPDALSRVEALDPAPLALAGADGASFAAEVRLTTVDLPDGPASLLLVRRLPETDPVHRVRDLELEAARLAAELSERDAILDTATDGVVVVDGTGRILSLNRAGQALFGYETNEIAGEPFTTLFETESHAAALDYLASLGREGVASLLESGREVLGRVRQGGAIPLFMTLGRVGEAAGEGEAPRFCAVLRDMTAFKHAEAELLDAKRAAEEASAQKSDFLARISHEVRTPLNAIIGFAEVMREERFGPVGNERYKDYLADIHASGQHVLSLINDLLDLAKIEAGRMDLAFRSVGLNELVGACVALMQPEAARERIVMRTSLLAKLPPVVADERSVRQIVLNLLSNAVRFTDAGGQVIVSTALTDRGEVAFRVRDTGIGMSEGEVEAALEPFRQLATARRPGGTGLGLPLTKALVEANRGAMAISSRKGEGTLVEVTFPVTVGAGV